MIIAVVGAGGKTSLIKELSDKYTSEGKFVFITTSTHMFIEENTLCTDDAQLIIAQLRDKGFAMAGVADGQKIKSLSNDTFKEVCKHADVVLVEADGSKHMPIKYPNKTEPVIPDNVDEIIVVCGLHALGQKAKDCCHRLELVKECLGIEDDTIITPAHIQKLVCDGYTTPLRTKYPNKKITVVARHNSTLYQRVISAMIENEADVSVMREEWFCPQPSLILCGSGHVAREVAAMASRMDFKITVIDERAELVTAERFPAADNLICDSYDNLEKYMEEGACYVLVTPEHKADLLCASKILPTKYSYLGMIGSKRKVAAAFESLRAANFTEEQIGTIFAPIGIPIGAVTPAEIAISILAQIIQEKNKSHSASADRELLETKEKGVLCIVTEKHGSAPRGVGSMMFVVNDITLGSIGGGEPEYLAILHARECDSIETKEYALSSGGSTPGGTIQVMFIPV